MINTEPKNIISTAIISITCDCCGKEYSDIMDRQEFTCVNSTGGFNSAIGDGVHYQCDLCSSCLKSLLGECLRIIDYEQT